MYVRLIHFYLGYVFHWLINCNACTLFTFTNVPHDHYFHTHFKRLCTWTSVSFPHIDSFGNVKFVCANSHRLVRFLNQHKMYASVKRYLSEWTMLQKMHHAALTQQMKEIKKQYVANYFLLLLRYDNKWRNACKRAAKQGTQSKTYTSNMCVFFFFSNKKKDV